MCRRSGLARRDKGAGLSGRFPCVGDDRRVCHCSKYTTVVAALSAFSPDTELFIGWFTVWDDMKPMPELSEGKTSSTGFSFWDLMGIKQWCHAHVPYKNTPNCEIMFIKKCFINAGQCPDANNTGCEEILVSWTFLIQNNVFSCCSDVNNALKLYLNIV